MKFIKTDDKTVEIKKVALNSIRVQDANISLTIGTEKFSYNATSRENALDIAYEIDTLEETNTNVLYLKVEQFRDSLMIVKELKINTVNNIFKNL
jgi:hypothetical protein